MAKAKTTKAVETAQKETLKATALLRKGVLAYIGLHGAAYERAKIRFEQVRGQADGLFDTFVEKGEEIEAKATVFAKDVQVKATETFNGTTAKVRSALPTASNDRVEELEAEIAALNKKIAGLAKKATPKKASAKKVKMTTEKMVKATAQKAA